jgi:hypothetical protein
MFPASLIPPYATYSHEIQTFIQGRKQLQVLVAPSTLPLMLYLLLKKVNQSFSTFLCSSDRSDQSGRHSSGLREDWPRAREASLPAKTMEVWFG